MKIGFSKGGLTLNGSKFNPLNLMVNGHGIAAEEPLPNTDPFELLQNLAEAKGNEVSRLDQIRILQSVMQK